MAESGRDDPEAGRDSEADDGREPDAGPEAPDDAPASERTALRLADFRPPAVVPPLSISGLGAALAQLPVIPQLPQVALVDAGVARAVAQLHADHARALGAAGDLSRIVADARVRTLLGTSRLTESLTAASALTAPFRSATLAGVAASIGNVSRTLAGAAQINSIATTGVRLAAEWNREFARMTLALRATDALFASLDTMPRPLPASLTGTALLDSTRALAAVSGEFYAGIASSAAALAAVPSWLRALPVLKIYTGARAGAAAGGLADDAALQEWADADVETFLDAEVDELERRLAAVDRAFVEPYRGAARAVAARPPDWVRHVTVSTRELADHLLNQLAPDSELEQWDPSPGDEHHRGGAWTRKARVRYLYRDVKTGGFARFADKLVDGALATFYPANDGVHTLLPAFTPLQARAYWRHVQGTISTLLEVAGY